MPHIIWDWNGTLLADQHIVLDAVNRSLVSVGWPTITDDDYRTHYTRPVRVFYERISARPVGDEEWRRIDEAFHVAYHDLLDVVELAPGAADVLSEHYESGRTQSLLSMYPHDALVRLVDRFDLTHLFTRIEGLRGLSGGSKVAALRTHVSQIRSPNPIVAIGDTPDDHVAASASSVDCVLFDGGSHHRPELETRGVPVAETIAEAVEHARAIAEERRTAGARALAEET